MLDPDSLKEKYMMKNALLGDCDVAFRKCETNLYKLNSEVAKELIRVESTLDRLQSVNSINNPSAKNAGSKQFYKDVQNYLTTANGCRDALETIQDLLKKDKDRILVVVTPLEQLHEREVRY